MTIEGEWSDLETKGYLVVRSFLDEAPLSVLNREYQKGLRPDAYFIGLKPLESSARRLMDERCRELFAHVRSYTGLRVDAVLKGYYFASAFINYGWHQDFDLLAQDLVNYLNLYVPIKKCVPEKTNLSIIPFDALEQQSTAVSRMLRGGTGNRFHKLSGNGEPTGYQVINVRDGSRTAVDVDFDELAVTPELIPGDLVMLRADAIHKTQDNETVRVAVSVRAVNSASVLRRDILMRSGTTLLEGQRREADQLFRCFSRAGTDVISMARLLEFEEG